MSDDRLERLEAALERERETSRQAASHLIDLRAREVAILHEPRPASPASTSTGGWTIDTVKEHFQVLRDADFRFYEERDRRYSEVNIEREKALKIKETADLAALGLAREIQDYKDEKANNLREQINAERGSYPTKAEMKPFMDYITGLQGRDRGFGISWGAVVVVLALLVDVGTRFIHP